MAKEVKKNIWYLKLPAFQYEEDVKALARKAGLRIVDANATEKRKGACDKPPKVTLKPEFEPKKDGK